MNELYKIHRPSDFPQVIGQEDAIASLKHMAKSHKFPHTLLFTGPSGTGKTTIVRILKNKLKCSDTDFIELNAAKERGIDIVRQIAERMYLAPLSGKSRVYLVDEAHQLTTQAQESFLKILEDTPKHVYFMLCTTDPQKLKNTVLTRCTRVNLKSINNSDMKKLVQNVLISEEKELEEKVIDRLVDVSDGSARKALVFLNQIIEVPDVEKQMHLLQASGAEKQAIDIARALAAKKNWKTLAGILKEVDEDPEQIRRLILSYATTMLLKGNEPAFTIIDCFKEHFYDSGRAGLVAAAYEATAEIGG